jgi:hypothetical protein
VAIETGGTVENALGEQERALRDSKQVDWALANQALASLEDAVTKLQTASQESSRARKWWKLAWPESSRTIVRSAKSAARMNESLKAQRKALGELERKLKPMSWEERLDHAIALRPPLELLVDKCQRQQRLRYHAADLGTAIRLYKARNARNSDDPDKLAPLSLVLSAVIDLPARLIHDEWTGRR